MRVRDGVVDLAVDEGARVIALALLESANVAAERYRQGEPAGLHDFRVALRRLRSTLRALGPWLGDGVSRRLERKLKRRARATNAPRDAEVQLAWLAASRSALGSRHRVGLELLVERLGSWRRAPDAERLVRRYRRTAAKLARRLGRHARGRDGAGAATEASFGAALATVLAGLLGDLGASLAAVRDASDRRGVHRARIAGKRLRYLLEPLAGNRHADSSEAVRRLKQLQDALGGLHDAHVLATEIGDALLETTEQRAHALLAAVWEPGGKASPRAALRDSPRPGLLALARLVRERRDALFGELDREWLGDGFATFAAGVEALAGALEARATAA